MVNFVFDGDFFSSLKKNLSSRGPSRATFPKKTQLKGPPAGLRTLEPGAQIIAKLIAIEIKCCRGAPLAERLAPR
jgi:hypothetical protein